MADVLIVDDDIDSATVLAEVMSAEGHEVRVGYNGLEGLRLATERLPDVALLDVEMPALDGPGLAYEMIAHDMGLEDVPIVFLSGAPNLRDVAARVGTPYLLGKPYHYEELLAVFARAIAERAPPRPLLAV